MSIRRSISFVSIFIPSFSAEISSFPSYLIFCPQEKKSNIVNMNFLLAATIMKSEIKFHINDARLCIFRLISDLIYDFHIHKPHNKHYKIEIPQPQIPPLCIIMCYLLPQFFSSENPSNFLVELWHGNLWLNPYLYGHIYTYIWSFYVLRKVK